MYMPVYYSGHYKQTNENVTWQFSHPTDIIKDHGKNFKKNHEINILDSENVTICMYDYSLNTN